MGANNYALLLHRRADLITGRLAEPFGEDGAADGGHDCAVCVEESEKREGWSLKGKSAPFLLSLACQQHPTCQRVSTRAVLGKLASRANSHVISIS